MTALFQSWGMAFGWAWFLATIIGILIICILFSALDPPSRLRSQIQKTRALSVLVVILWI